LDIGKFVPVGFPVFLRVQRNTKRLGTALASTLQSGFGPLRLPLIQDLERVPDRLPLRVDEAVQEAVRSWLRGAGTDFYRTSIFKDSAKLAEMHRSGWRFFTKVIKVSRFY
jgi:hypothetical protein